MANSTIPFLPLPLARTILALTVATLQLLPLTLVQGRLRHRREMMSRLVDDLVLVP